MKMFIGLLLAIVALDGALAQGNSVDCAAVVETAIYNLTNIQEAFDELSAVISTVTTNTTLISAVQAIATFIDDYTITAYTAGQLYAGLINLIVPLKSSIYTLKWIVLYSGLAADDVADFELGLDVTLQALCDVLPNLRICNDLSVDQRPSICACTTDQKRGGDGGKGWGKGGFKGWGKGGGKDGGRGSEQFWGKGKGKGWCKGGGKYGGKGSGQFWGKGWGKGGGKGDGKPNGGRPDFKSCCNKLRNM